MIVIIESSPRDGNGSYLGQFIRSSYKNEEIFYYKLWDLNYRGCNECKLCKRNNSLCVVEDDLLPVWKKLAAADLIVFISPIYYGQINGEMKQFVDRIYCMKGSDKRSKFKQGAKIFLILTQNSMQRDDTKKVQDWFKDVSSVYGLKFLGYTVPGCSNANTDSAERVSNDMLLNLTFFY